MNLPFRVSYIENHLDFRPSNKVFELTFFDVGIIISYRNIFKTEIDFYNYQTDKITKTQGYKLISKTYCLKKTFPFIYLDNVITKSFTKNH